MEGSASDEGRTAAATSSSSFSSSSTPTATTVATDATASASVSGSNGASAPTQTSSKAASTLTTKTPTTTNTTGATGLAETYEAGKRTSGRSIKRPKFDDEVVEFRSRPRLSSVQQAHGAAAAATGLAAAEQTAAAAVARAATSGVAASDPAVAAAVAAAVRHDHYRRRADDAGAAGAARNPAPAAPSLTDPLGGVGDVVGAPATHALPYTSTLTYADGAPFGNAVGTEDIEAFARRVKEQRQQLGARAQAAAGYAWTASDDLLLINAVQQVSDVRLVHRLVRFSRRFTEAEVAARWRTLFRGDEATSETCRAEEAQAGAAGSAAFATLGQGTLREAGAVDVRAWSSLLPHVPLSPAEVRAVRRVLAGVGSPRRCGDDDDDGEDASSGVEATGDRRVVLCEALRGAWLDMVGELHPSRTVDALVDFAMALEYYDAMSARARAGVGGEGKGKGEDENEDEMGAEEDGDAELSELFSYVVSRLEQIEPLGEGGDHGDVATGVAGAAKAVSAASGSFVGALRDVLASAPEVQQRIRVKQQELQRQQDELRRRRQKAKVLKVTLRVDVPRADEPSDAAPVIRIKKERSNSTSSAAPHGAEGAAGARAGDGTLAKAEKHAGLKAGGDGTEKAKARKVKKHKGKRKGKKVVEPGPGADSKSEGRDGEEQEGNGGGGTATAAPAASADAMDTDEPAPTATAAEARDRAGAGGG